MNRLERLKEQLQSAVRGREITNQDIANLLGCGRPTISVAIRTGEFNTRLSRTLDFVDIAIAAHGIGDLFVFIDEDKYSDEAQIKKGMKMLDKVERNSNYVIAERQIDFADDNAIPSIAVKCDLDFLSDELKALAEEALTPKQKAQASALYRVSHTAAIGMIENIIKNSSKIDDKKESIDKIIRLNEVFIMDNHRFFAKLITSNHVVIQDVESGETEIIQKGDPIAGGYKFEGFNDDMKMKTEESKINSIVSGLELSDFIDDNQGRLYISFDGQDVIYDALISIGKTPDEARVLAQGMRNDFNAGKPTAIKFGYS